MGKADERRTAMLTLLESGEEVTAGSVDRIPMEPAALAAIDRGSPHVEKRFGSGLTAEVFKVAAGGKSWNLKKKRDEILVRNIDGQASFLNEILRRKDFEKLKMSESEAYSGIVDTAYASLSLGIIVSPWIDGGHIEDFTRETIKNLFDTLFSVEKAGLFEFDLCPGNILVQKDGKARLFDFGYMYPYDPLREYNPDGLENPVFHPVERFESRNFMQYLMNLEKGGGLRAALEAFRIEKEEALEYYERRLAWFSKMRADDRIVEWTENIVKSWETGLSGATALEKLYEIESFRSHVIDLHDDVSGKSCTPETLEKAEKVVNRLERDHDLLARNGALFWGDERLGRDELLAKYRKMAELAREYQIR